MLHDLAFAFWFLLPAAAGNVAPILVAPLPLIRKWDWPMDFGRTWRGKRVLGTHKTWRGLASGIIAATLAFMAQQWLVRHVSWLGSLVEGTDFTSLPFIVGPLFGLGALGGDAIKSFFKRQYGVEAGHSWMPFDQLDYIVGAVLCTLPFMILSGWIYIWIIVVWFGMHLLFSYIGWLLGLKERPL